MKRIINKKTYNTETATKVAEWDNGIRDFKAEEEELYITKKGAWFLYYAGCPASKYAEHYGRTSSWGSGIRVYASDDAYNWLEKNNQTDIIEKYFPEKIEEA